MEVVMDILAFGFIAAIVVAAIKVGNVQKRKREETGPSLRSALSDFPAGRVRIFETSSKKQKYEAGLYNEPLGLHYRDQAEKDAHESGDLVLYEGELITPQQKVEAEQRLEEKRRWEYEQREDKRRWEHEQRVQEERQLEEKQRPEEERANPTKRRTMSPGEYAELKGYLYWRQNGECVYCNRSLPEDVLEIDHKIPVAQGGTDELRNVH